MKSYEELLAERDALAAAVAVLREYIERGSPVNINPEKCERRKLLARAPQQCLAEIKAEAGRAGYCEGFRAGLVIDPPLLPPSAGISAIDNFRYRVDQAARANAYQCAAKIRSTGTWLKDSNVNGGKRQGGE